MTAWYKTRRTGWSAKVVVAAGLLAVLLVAAVPVALLVGLILMLFGHVIVGLALFGASVLAAVAAVSIAAVTGVRHLRGLLTQLGQRGPGQPGPEQYPVIQLHQGDYDYR